MPCRVEPTEAELEASRQARTNSEIAKVVKPLKKRNDELTHENDQLREVVLKMVKNFQPSEDVISRELLEQITLNQVEHRKEDLRRLDKYFTKYLEDSVKTQGLAHALQTQDFKDVFARLEKVMAADPEKPLEPQLGFDPDKY